MTTKRTERRVSALTGQTPVNTQTAPAPATTPPPVAPVAAPARPSASKAGRTKMNYYADTDDAGRIRAAFFAGRDKYRWRTMTDMQLQGMMGLVEALEAEFNGGEHFEEMPPGTGPVGRPLE